MSQTDPTPADPHQDISLAAPEEVYKQSMKAVGKLVERITPWLVDFGSWIFGGLIAFNLLIVAALITVGPVDPAIRVSTTAFALALPPDVAGFFLLRLVQDMQHASFEEEMAHAFEEVGFTVGEQVASPTAFESMRKRSTGIVLRYAYGILVLSVVLTLIGMTAALWHMAWWIALAFFSMVLISLGMVIVAIVTSPPPDSPKEKERKRRVRDEMTRQAKAKAFPPNEQKRAAGK